MNIYLIGFMGSGKSTTGRKIASLLHLNFTDTDHLVEKQEGKAIPEIFSLMGEEYFRTAEQNALISLSEKSGTVVACGGGTPCSAENLNIMKSTGVTVYLRMPAEDLAKRLENPVTERPLLKGKKGDELISKVKEMLDLRRKWYEQADLIIDTENLSEEDITTQITVFMRSKGVCL